jgi:hypothetical protein
MIRRINGKPVIVAKKRYRLMKKKQFHPLPRMHIVVVIAEATAHKE